MIVFELAVFGNNRVGWAFRGQKDSGKWHIVCGAAQGTTNQGVLVAAAEILKRIERIRPEACGILGAGGAHVLVRASQQYLIRQMNGLNNGRANAEQWDALLETYRNLRSKGFVFRWEHLPKDFNEMREVATEAARECQPTLLNS